MNVVLFSCLSICLSPLRPFYKLQRWRAGNSLLFLFGETSVGLAEGVKDFYRPQSGNVSACGLFVMLSEDMV